MRLSTDASPRAGERPELRAPFADRVVDLLADAPPPSWAVEGFAAHGTLTVLAAPTATGKTWLALQLAQAAGEGSPSDVAGLRCNADRALYVDAENGPSIIATRLDAARVGEPRFVYVDGRGLRLDAADHREELADAIRHYRTDFVVLDSLRRLAPDAREDSSDDMGRLIGGLAVVARETGAAILLQTHKSSKSGAARVRGSSAIEDQADTVFSLTRARGGPVRQLAAVKYRLGPEPSPLTLRFREDPPGFVAASGSVQGGLAEAVDALADRVRESGSWTFGELADALGLDSRDAADRKRLQRALSRLVEVGGWANVERGRYAPADVDLKARGHGTPP
jgi:hypothetical protein